MQQNIHLKRILLFISFMQFIFYKCTFSLSNFNSTRTLSNVIYNSIALIYTHHQMKWNNKYGINLIILSSLWELTELKFLETLSHTFAFDL